MDVAVAVAVAVLRTDAATHVMRCGTRNAELAISHLLGCHHVDEYK